MTFSFSRERLVDMLVGEMHEWDAGFHTLLADSYTDPVVHQKLTNSYPEQTISLEPDQKPIDQSDLDFPMCFLQTLDEDSDNDIKVPKVM